MSKALKSNPLQISAHISQGTKEKLDRLTRARGLRKGFVLEQALQYYFRALEDLPEEAFIPPRLILNEEGWSTVMELIEDPPAPTQAMMELMGSVHNTSSGKK